MDNTLTTLVERQLKKYGPREAFYGQAGPGKWEATTWPELSDQSEALACALVKLGVAEQERVAVFSANRSRILVSDFACFAIRAVPVSIYSTSSAEQVAYIVGDSAAKIIFVGDEAQYRMARGVAAETECLRQIVCYTDFPLDADDSTTLRFADLIAMGQVAEPDAHAEVARRRASARPDDIATLLYTSGTTGEPKGAILPHSCFDSCLAMHHERLVSLTDADTSVSFLPLSHIFEKAWTYFCLDMGIRVYVNTDPRAVQDALREVRPTCMCAVPRFWEKAYTTIQDKMGRMKPWSRLFLLHALAIGRRRNLRYARLGLKAPRWLESRYQFYAKKVFRKVHRMMGMDRALFLPTAGAPLSPAITEFFLASGIPLIIGYGLSETTATVTCYPYVGYEVGTVGTPLPGLEVKIGPQNEVLVKGPTVMRGYYNKPELTAEVFTPDGFFRTGDAGRFDASGALILTERLKDLFKTSNGKYIAPQALESRLGEDPLIEQVAVIGDCRKYVTALIVPAFGAVKDYAKKKKINFKSIDDLLRNPQIKELYQQHIDACQASLPSYEQIKKFTLLPREFSMERGELTNTLKLRRPAIATHFARDIDAMYS